MTAARTMLEGIYAHSQFANARLLDQAEQLSDAELDAVRPGMFSTIRLTLLHMLQAQRSWLRRFRELEPVAPLELADLPTIADLRRVWNEVDADTFAYLATVTDEQLQAVIRMRSWSGWEMEAPRWQALVHQAFHQHQHRGELAMVLTNLGLSPGEIDGFDWFETEGTAHDVTPGRAPTL